jgi:hypothetical protein
MLAGDRDLSPWTDIESQQTDFNEPMSDRIALAWFRGNLCFMKGIRSHVMVELRLLEC